MDRDTASQEAKAKRPLRQARVDVTEDKSSPGKYQAIAYLKPHFQLDELGVSLRLVADLPAPANQ
jgi:type VI secretion system protein ImpC